MFIYYTLILVCMYRKKIEREIGTICVFRYPLRVLELLYSFPFYVKFLGLAFFGLVCVSVCVSVFVHEGPQILPVQ